MYQGPIIDCHAHTAFTERGRINERHRLGADAHLAAVRRPGVVHAAAIVMAAPGVPEDTAADNDAVVAAAAASDGFLLPVISVHPDDGPVALAELDRVAGLGARVLKLHPNTQALDVAGEAVEAVVRRAGEHGMVVLFDGMSPFDADQPGKLLKLAFRCPQTRMILAHCNGFEFSRLMVYQLLQSYPWWRGNVYHDLSWTVAAVVGSPYQEQFRWVIRQIGLDRVLYGSDWPMCGPDDALAAVRSLGLTDEEEHQVLYATAAELLDLG